MLLSARIMEISNDLVLGVNAPGFGGGAPRNIKGGECPLSIQKAMSSVGIAEESHNLAHGVNSSGFASGAARNIEGSKSVTRLDPYRRCGVGPRLVRLALADVIGRDAVEAVRMSGLARKQC